MKNTILSLVIAIVIGIIVSIGLSELYARNESFRKGYIAYGNAIENKLHGAEEAIGLHAPKLVFVE